MAHTEEDVGPEVYPHYNRGVRSTKQNHTSLCQEPGY